MMIGVAQVIGMKPSLRNHILDFLVSRSRGFAFEVPGHDARNVPTVRVGPGDPTIVTAREFETCSAQRAAR